MTTTNTYNATRANIGQYVANQGTNPIKAMLVAGYIHDPDHADAADVTASEITTGGAARITLTCTITTYLDKTYLSSSDPTFATATFTACDGIVLFADEGADADSPLICHLSFSPVDVTADSLTVELDQVDGNGVWLEFTADTAEVLSVAGVGPDSNGDVPAASLVAALLEAITTIDGGDA